jgi:hypothetical protein
MYLYTYTADELMRITLVKEGWDAESQMGSYIKMSWDLKQGPPNLETLMKGYVNASKSDQSG